MKTYVIHRGIEFDTSVTVAEGSKIERLRFHDVRAGENVGGIYVGKVLKVEKGLECAFIDIGTEKTAFLQLKDWPKNDKIGSPSGLAPGRMCIVQIFRESAGDKGPRVTGKISVKSSFGVLLPYEKGIFISREIDDAERRNEITGFVQKCVSDEFGLIVRTLSRGMGEASFAREVENLKTEYDRISKAVDTAARPGILREVNRFDEELEEFLKGDGNILVTNDDGVYETAVSMCDAVGDRDAKKRVSLSKDSRDLLDEISVRHAVSDFFTGRVHVEDTKSELVRNLTEAFTVYDVNSASSVSGASFKENYMKVNRASILKVYEDLVRYNLSGTVLVDLIGLENDGERAAILSFAKKRAVRYDKGITAHGVSRLGILEITRNKEKLPLHMIVGDKCGCCSSGFVAGQRYMLGWILEGIVHYKKLGFAGVMVLANDKFFDTYDIEAYAKAHGLGAYVSVKVDALVDAGRFKLRPMGSSTSKK